MKLSVLICTLEERKTLFDVLIARINRILLAYNVTEVQILSECDNRQMSIGEKRNLLLSRAEGDYVCFIDDDDTIDEEYFIRILKALESEPDCVELIGMMNTDGLNQKRFEHSIKHSTYHEYNNTYFRYPNHLNPIKREIAMRFKFPETNFGEDTEWATQIRDSGLLRIESRMDKVIYHYRYRSRK